MSSRTLKVSFVLASLLCVFAQSAVVKALTFSPVPGFVDGDFEGNNCPDGADHCLPSDTSSPLNSYPWLVPSSAATPAQSWQGFVVFPSLVNNSDVASPRFPGGIPSGNNAATLAHPVGPPLSSSNAFYQIFSIGTYEANRIYRLSGFFGYDTKEVAAGRIPTQAEVSLHHGPGYPTDAIIKLGDDSGDTPAVGSFVPFEIAVNTLTNPELVGGDILVRIGAIGSFLYETTTSWDNLRLEVAQIPEPSTMVMLMAVFIAMPVIARK